MADNTHEETVDNSPNIQSENPSDEITSAERPVAIVQNHETENMEVHKHPHHVTHKKKWGEYFLEFLMLFLAVFLGFVAENIREHSVEQSRAIEFSKSLVQDLQNDTTAITRQEKLASLYINLADSLMELSKTKLEGRNAAEFSFYTRFAYWTGPVSWSRATFEQIKNSGGLRYFKNAQLLKKLLEYDAIINDIEAESNVNAQRGIWLLQSINSIIDPLLHKELSKYYLATLERMSAETREHYFSFQAGSLENKREIINGMLNMVVVQQRNLSLQMDTRLPKANALATEIISDLKKEYHLE